MFPNQLTVFSGQRLLFEKLIKSIIPKYLNYRLATLNYFSAGFEKYFAMNTYIKGFYDRNGNDVDSLANVLFVVHFLKLY